MSDTRIYVTSWVISLSLELVIRGGPRFCRWVRDTLNLVE